MSSSRFGIFAEDVAASAGPQEYLTQALTAAPKGAIFFNSHADQDRVIVDGATLHVGFADENDNAREYGFCVEHNKEIMAARRRGRAEANFNRIRHTNSTQSDGVLAIRSDDPNAGPILNVTGGWKIAVGTPPTSGGKIFGVAFGGDTVDCDINFDNMPNTGATATLTVNLNPMIGFTLSQGTSGLSNFAPHASYSHGMWSYDDSTIRDAVMAGTLCIHNQETAVGRAMCKAGRFNADLVSSLVHEQSVDAIADPDITWRGHVGNTGNDRAETFAIELGATVRSWCGQVDLPATAAADWTPISGLPFKPEIGIMWSSMRTADADAGDATAGALAISVFDTTEAHCFAVSNQIAEETSNSSSVYANQMLYSLAHDGAVAFDIGQGGVNPMVNDGVTVPAANLDVVTTGPRRATLMLIGTPPVAGGSNKSVFMVA